MNITVFPKKLNGQIDAIPSKSMAHRYLICAAFSNMPTEIKCSVAGTDIDATVSCLQALGAQIVKTASGYQVVPIDNVAHHAVLPCAESGSTLRFLVPVVGALGVDAVFVMHGRLAQRPLEPLIAQMSRKGCRISWIDDHTLHCSGKLQSGSFCITGSISSQFITGLIFACMLLEGNNRITVEGQLTSKPYVQMTFDALSHFGVDVSLDNLDSSELRSPGVITVEGDWSCGACYVAANALGSNIQVRGLNTNSSQGDHIICMLLQQIESQVDIDVSNCPDLVPVLSVFAAAKQGARFLHTGRLRFKESDRIASIIDMLESLGCHADADEDSLTVYPGVFQGGSVNAYNDHRIVMAAAIAATCATGPVTIGNANCVDKSYPGFWDDYRKLGGIYEQHIR